MRETNRISTPTAYTTKITQFFNEIKQYLLNIGYIKINHT